MYSKAAWLDMISAVILLIASVYVLTAFSVVLPSWAQLGIGLFAATHLICRIDCLVVNSPSAIDGQAG